MIMEHFYTEGVVLATHEAQQLLDDCHWWDRHKKKVLVSLIGFLNHINELDDETHATRDIGFLVFTIMYNKIDILEPILQELVPPIDGMEIDIGVLDAD
jgi:hypothetical protein